MNELFCMGIEQMVSPPISTPGWPVWAFAACLVHVPLDNMTHDFVG